MRFTGVRPFGHSDCLAVKTLYATTAGGLLRAVAKRTMPPEPLSTWWHPHHALDDAVEQAELFAHVSTRPGATRA